MIGRRASSETVVGRHGLAGVGQNRPAPLSACGVESRHARWIQQRRVVAV